MYKKMGRGTRRGQQISFSSYFFPNSTWNHHQLILSLQDVKEKNHWWKTSSVSKSKTKTKKPLNHQKMQHIQGFVTSINFALPIEALFFFFLLRYSAFRCPQRTMGPTSCHAIKVLFCFVFLKSNILLILLILSPQLDVFTDGSQVRQPRFPSLGLHSWGPTRFHERRKIPHSA